jgi:hypothetical protein
MKQTGPTSNRTVIQYTVRMPMVLDVFVKYEFQRLYGNKRLVLFYLLTVKGESYKQNPHSSRTKGCHHRFKICYHEQSKTPICGYKHLLYTEYGKLKSIIR